MKKKIFCNYVILCNYKQLLGNLIKPLGIIHVSDRRAESVITAVHLAVLC